MKRIAVIIFAVILVMASAFVCPPHGKGSTQLFGPMQVNAAIVGDTDSRERVEDTLTAPYSMTCYILSEYGNGLYEIGSGILVGPNIALTCCHCVMDSGNIASSITVIPGKNGTYEPFGRTTVNQVVRHSKLDVDHEFNQDWAVLKLDSDIGNEAGWAPLIPPMDQESGNYKMHIWNIGYPDPNNTPFAQESQGDDRLMLVGEGEILEEWGDNVVSGDWDCTSGDSGGPVFTKSGNDEYMLVGLASAGSGIGNEEFPDSYSLCTLIGDDVYGIVDELLNEGSQDERPADGIDWESGTYYYAEGYGLSAYFYQNTGSNYVCEIMNYNSTQDPYVGSAFHIYFLEWTDDTHLRSNDGQLSISLWDDGGVEIEFADITEFYRQEPVVVFYPADPDAKSTGADRFEGTFREIDEYSGDYQYYYTIKNLFGSRDYVMECRVTEYGNVRDQVMLVMLEEQGDLLVHRYEPGDIYPMPTYGCYLVDGERMYSSEGSTLEEDFPNVLQMLQDGFGIAYERTADFWE